MHRTLSHLQALAGLVTAGALAVGLSGCFGVDHDVPPYAPNGLDPITVTDEPPPAISGGTLRISRDGRTAIAADPDRDGVWVVDIEAGAPTFLPVERYDEPGRVVEDQSGRAFVALNRGGAIVTVDLASRQIVDRREVCPAPRGMAYDGAHDTIHVACAGGELMTLPAAGGPAIRTLRLDRDLRDVVIDGDRLLVSRFRSAETLVVSAEGLVLSRRELPMFHADGGTGSQYRSNVAWRMVPRPSGGAVMVHQRAMTSQVILAPGGYYSNAGCTGAIVHSAVSLIDPAAEDSDPLAPATAAIPTIALPVDVAVSPDGTSVAMISASNDMLVKENIGIIENESGMGNCFPSVSQEQVAGQPIAVAFTPTGTVVVQLREPAGLQIIGGTVISLPGESMRDTGHEMFHRSPNGFSPIACASCHPAGHEDGHTWSFDPVGLRRTQAIGGGVLDTAPLHWNGDLKDLSALMDEVFVGRMTGMPPGARRTRLIGRFINALPAFPASPPQDQAAADHGEELFNSETVGCAKCHSGPKLTNNESKDIGFGYALQVPSLIGVSGRAPYMHDGCATTLLDRFTDPSCGGSDHGNVSGLSEQDLNDLVAYLESL